MPNDPAPESSALERAPTDFSTERVALIRRTVCGKVTLTNDEFALFIEYAKRTGLDPIRRHLHAVKRKGTMTIQTGIDGYRLIARRDGLAGIDDAVFEDHVAEKFPMKATVTVYRWGPTEQRETYTASARWDEYYPGNGDQGFMWRKMPHTMLAKCAEALALRKGFQECAGLYVDEEMDQADARSQPDPAPQNETPPKTEAPPAGKLDGLRQAVSDRIGELFKRDDPWTARVITEGEDVARVALFESIGVPTRGRLNADHLRKVKAYLDERLAALQQDADAEAGQLDPPYDPETGEVKDPPAPYDAGDGFELEHPGNDPSSDRDGGQP